jgi:hypothetical protein
MLLLGVHSEQALLHSQEAWNAARSIAGARQTVTSNARRCGDSRAAFHALVLRLMVLGRTKRAHPYELRGERARCQKG